MLRSLLIVALLCCSPFSFAVELEAGKIYRLSITTEVKRLDDSSTIYVALMNSKFEVIGKDDNGNYIVRFVKVYTSSDDHHVSSNWVTWDNAYILPSKIDSSIKVENVSKVSLTGLSAGPLVVPFKFRSGDDSLSGDATIGMYAGITFEPGCTKSNWCFRFTPLISAGLSQVTVANEEGSESKTSATWAAGFLITNWADLNIGIVYGEDRIGDGDWEHEGDGWWSIMFGWEL